MRVYAHRKKYLKYKYFEKLLNDFGDHLNSKDKLKLCFLCFEGKIFKVISFITKLKLNKALRDFLCLL